MKYFTCLILFSLVLSSMSTSYKSCDEPIKSEIESVTLSSCPTPENTCPLVKNTIETTTIRFKSLVDSSSVTAVLHGSRMVNREVVGSEENIPLDHPDACKSGLSCPIWKGQEYTYMNSENATIPDYDYLSKFMLKDDRGENIVCFIIPVEYVKQ
ncbi:NPC intracellular cholesterol transporter 2 [Parasteatoda tepidariorum]|uniref:NPC intracellular cholesterol transporter 2 n=1 Tax=Parasteatoda tepidariorum TaxID=114398 RepID=UPI00077FBD83|nr:NPC intracellular cholesterol transporter 2 [Parasteatoda tepidariorum]